MSARKTILSLAKEKNIKATDLAKKMKYDHVNSLYRALANPGSISYKKIKGLAKGLGISVCEVILILK